MKEDQIISLNLEDYQFDDIKNYKDLYEYIEGRLQDNQMNYIFIDEVQQLYKIKRRFDNIYKGLWILLY